MREWLQSLKLPGWLREELATAARCECGAPATAVGIFRSRTNLTNALWLCARCALDVDPGVTVHVIPEVCEMEQTALFDALVRAEIKRLTDRNGPPDRQRWDRQRGSHLPDVKTVERRLGVTYEEVVAVVSFR